jgi:hypothetical protein
VLPHAAEKAAPPQPEPPPMPSVILDQLDSRRGRRCTYAPRAEKSLASRSILHGIVATYRYLTLGVYNCISNITSDFTTFLYALARTSAVTYVSFTLIPGQCSAPMCSLPTWSPIYNVNTILFTMGVNGPQPASSTCFPIPQHGLPTL